MVPRFGGSGKRAIWFITIGDRRWKRGRRLKILSVVLGSGLTQQGGSPQVIELYKHYLEPDGDSK